VLLQDAAAEGQHLVCSKLGAGGGQRERESVCERGKGGGMMARCVKAASWACCVSRTRAGSVCCSPARTPSHTTLPRRRPSTHASHMSRTSHATHSSHRRQLPPAAAPQRPRAARVARRPAAAAAAAAATEAQLSASRRGNGGQRRRVCGGVCVFMCAGSAHMNTPGWVLVAAMQRPV
jgi:hypothetical protein